MLRWIAALSTLLLLSGCVTTEYVYRDRYPDSRYAQDGYYDSRYYRDGSYYSPSYDGRGDYYYRRPQYGYSYGYSDYPSWYWDYPYYYSVFWPMYRSWYDPYWHPHFYYGVTYYPNNYFSISYHSGWGWSRYGYQYYSPYRYSWVDNYYDWRPWHGHHGYRDRYYYQTPRYGSARNEAERLSRMSDWRSGNYGQAERGQASGPVRNTAFGTYGTSRSGVRDADYHSRTSPRQDPGAGGFGAPGQDDVRRNAYGGGTRQAPAAGGFGVPIEGDVRGRGPDYGGSRARAQPPVSGFGAAPAPNEAVPNDYARQPRYGASREIGRYGSGALPGYSRDARDAGGVDTAPTRYGRARGYDDQGMTLPRQSAPGYEARRYETPVERDYTPPTRGYDRPSRPERSYDAPAPREYSSPAREAFSAPMPEPRRYEAPEPRSYAAPEPRFEAREAPQFETRDEPRFEARSESSESHSDDDGGVRRVGSNRDE